MPPLTINQVCKLPLDGQAIAHFHLDHPTVSERFPGHAVDVVGWIIGRHGPVRRIEIQHGQDIIRQADVWIPRADVVQELALPPGRVWNAILKRWPKAYQLARQLLPSQPAEAPAADSDAATLTSGFHVSASLLGLPAEFELQVVAVLDDDSRVTVASLRGQRSLLESRYQPRRRPIVMTHLGRSGSTWLAHLLAEHPDVIVHRRYPHEANAAIHTMRVMQVMATPTNAVRQADLANVNLTLDCARPMPLFCQEDDQRLHQWLRRDYVQRHADFCLETIDVLYDEIAAGQGKLQARYYSEKLFVFPLLASLFHELYRGGKELFLIRDFRDLICSRYCFFGPRRAGNATLAKTIRETGERVRLLRQAWAERGDRCQLVRYEDLVLRPADTLQAIFDYLEIDSSRPTIDSVIARASQLAMGQHLTSSDPVQSIGRWRRDLPSDLQALVNEKFRDSLLLFGYHIDRAAQEAEEAT